MRLLDRSSLSQMSLVNKTFHELSNNPSVFKDQTIYSGASALNSLSSFISLPPLEAVVPFPPPAHVATTLPVKTQVRTGPGLETTLPASTTFVVPVLPESVPLVARVPDVVMAPGGANIVPISQVLPGYAPSYVPDYVPPQVNGESFSAFVNTISFNVSRYPTLSQVRLVDSKEYSKRKSSGDFSSPSPNCQEKGVKAVSSSTSLQRPAAPHNPNSSAASKYDPVLSPNNPFTTIRVHEYVPAEYFRGSETLCGQNTMPISGASKIEYLPPDVLGSGRLLTYMTAVATTTTSTSTMAIGGLEAASIVEVVKGRNGLGSGGDGEANNPTQ